MSETLQSDTSRFPSETMDGETVLIDADRGHLLLLTGLGPWLWSRFERATDPAAVLAELESAFGIEARTECAEFIASMGTLELLVEPAAATESPDPTPPLPATYIRPVIESFEDISEIIQMDPIHEVDPNAGWPNAGNP